MAIVEKLGDSKSEIARKFDEALMQRLQMMLEQNEKTISFTSSALLSLSDKRDRYINQQ